MKKIKQKEVFTKNGTFESYYAACHWLTENGYSYGSMCCPQPIGIMKGDYNIQKWKNLSNFQISQLHGVMTSSDWREGSVLIEIFE
jgi:hypothetical protein